MKFILAAVFMFSLVFKVSLVEAQPGAASAIESMACCDSDMHECHLCHAAIVEPTPANLPPPKNIQVKTIYNSFFPQFKSSPLKRPPIHNV